MTKRSIIVLLFIPLLLTACGGGGDKLSFNRINVNKEVAIEKGENAPHCIVELQMDCLDEKYGETAKTLNEAINQRVFYLENLTMQQAADSFANKYCRDYVVNYAPLYREDKASQEKHAWYEYRYKVTTETIQEVKGVVTYLINIEYYEGGAHGISQQLALNFNAENGEKLTLHDVLAPGFEQQLNEMLLEALLDETGAKDINQLHEEGYLYSMDIFASDNFIIGDDEITFIYNPYEIADYNKGMIKLSIDTDNFTLKD
jgi:hypothetical protein